MFILKGADTIHILIIVTKLTHKETVDENSQTDKEYDTTEQCSPDGRFFLSLESWKDKVQIKEKVGKYKNNVII